MRHAGSSVALAFVVALGLAACGDDPKAPPAPAAAPSGPSGKPAGPDPRNVEIEPAKRDAVKQRLVALLELARDKKFADGAPFVVYRGDDPARKPWQETCDYARDKLRVDVMLTRLRRLLAKGEPVFTGFQAQRQSEGLWLVWSTTFGDTKTELACLELDGKIAIGDID
jgi:hypothetical protein